MAITTYNEPSGKQSVQDSLWHCAVSDNSGLTNFKYVFDVYDNANNQLIRSKIYPDVNDGWGYFDAGSVVRNEVLMQWFVMDKSGMNMRNLQAGENEITYKVKVGEEYNIGASGITTLNMASGTITAYNYFPGLWNRRQLNIDTLYADYYSNRPRYGYTGWGENFVISFYRSGSVTIEVKKYTEAGSLVSTSSKSKNLTSANFHIMNIGMEAINAEFASAVFASGDTGYYTVSIDSKLFTVYIKCASDYTPINLFFMNAYGVMDTARFDCTNKLSMTATRKKYERKEVQFSNGVASYYQDLNSNGIKVYNETGINYAQDLAWTYRLSMNFPTDAEWQWLVELVYSPQIYMEIDGDLYPVTIKTTNYEYNKQLWAKLKTFDIEVEVNQKRQGFRR